MKNTKWMIGVVLLFGMVCAPYLVFAQNNILVITKSHRNPGVQTTPGEWRAIEKEYFDKVTAKNEYILGANVLVHYFTDDNSEILFINVYKSWEDIEKAGDRNNELARAAWPDSVKRREFMSKQNSFYTHKHSDEIMTIMPYSKPFPTDTNQHIIYFRTTHRGYPNEVEPGEFRSVMNEYMDNIVKKNDLIKGYGMARHFWGADSREILEVSTFDNMADLEKSFEINDELEKKHWPDQAQRDAFFKSFDKFFSPWHSDALYHNVPGLRK